MNKNIKKIRSLLLILFHYGHINQQRNNQYNLIKFASLFNLKNVQFKLNELFDNARFLHYFNLTKNYSTG